MLFGVMYIHDLRRKSRCEYNTYDYYAPNAGRSRPWPNRKPVANAPPASSRSPMTGRPVEMALVLRRLGYEAVWKDWDSALGESSRIADPAGQGA
jgi:hypothetical protein